MSVKGHPLIQFPSQLKQNKLQSSVAQLNLHAEVGQQVTTVIVLSQPKALVCSVLDKTIKVATKFHSSIAVTLTNSNSVSRNEMKSCVKDLFITLITVIQKIFLVHFSRNPASFDKYSSSNHIYEIEMNKQ